jgi:Protein of unknown function (DUF1822)
MSAKMRTSAMMSKTPMAEQSKLTITLSIDAHTLARQVAMQQFTAQKAKQSYLDTLARYAVNFYLQCVGIETQLESHDDPLMVSMMDITDVELPGIGKLECRVVLPGETTVKFPEEVWCDRIGYMAVQVNEALTEAEILGFVATVNVEELSFQQLQPVESILLHLHELETPISVDSVNSKKLVQLHQWLSDIFEEGWDTIESIFAAPQVAWRSVPVQKTRIENPETDDRLSPQVQERSLPLPKTKKQLSTGVQRGKRLNFSRGEQVALMLEVIPQDAEPMDIWVRLFSIGENLDLPEDLQFNVLDDRGEAIAQLKARETPDMQIQLSASLGEEFSVQVSLDDESLTESFVV